MHPIVYYIFIFLAIGGSGMAIANKNANKEVRRQRWLKYFMYIFITGVVVLGIFYNFIQWVAIAIVVAGLFELIKVNTLSRLRSGPAFASFFLFVLISVGFILFIRTFHYTFLLFIYFQVLVFDGFCQITGQLFGRHQLAPKISAAKTVEGLLGGWIFCLLAALMCANWVNVSLTEALIFGFGTGLSSFTGDMMASWYKRKVSVKDYSNWLPGQGGFLDRFDSFLMTGTFYFLLHLLIFKDRLASFVN